MSGPIADRTRRIARWLAEFALPLIAVAIALVYLGYGVSECRAVCSAYGEAWHAGGGDVLPPVADGCTCVDGEGSLRRRLR